MLYGGELDESFPSMIMTYYTEKARKKQTRKQRGAGVQPKSVFSRIFAIFRPRGKPLV